MKSIRPTKVAVGIGVFSLLLFGGIVLYDQQKNATGQEQLGTRVDLLADRSHIAVGAPHEPYNSNPPTSGPHYAAPAGWGSYDTPLPDEQLVHNLEHGGINLFYKPGSVDQATIDALKAIQRDFPRKTVVAPRPHNEKPIAIASWGYYMNLDSFDEGTIREFVRRNKNKAPEFFPD